MKVKNLIFFFLLLLMGMSFGQQKKSNGDVLFFEYDYQGAIQEYLKEMRKTPLSNQQYLNLAESYFKVEDFSAAASTYMDLYKSEVDLSANQLNKLFQALNMNVGRDSTRSFFYNNSEIFSAELRENAQFNFDLLNSDVNPPSDIEIFNVTENSREADFAPSFYKDQLLFTSSRNRDPNLKNNANSPASFLNIYQANISTDGNLVGSGPASIIPEFKYHQGTPYYSEALDEVFYIRSNEQADELVYDSEGKNALAIGSVNKSGNFRLLFKDLSTSFYYPFYDDLSGKLYFAAEFEEGFGGTDIYYVYTNNGLIMSSPINLGPRVNTPGNEIAPYIFEGSLYFSSDIFYGFGGMDIYRSEIMEEGFFSIPVNLGEGLNSEKDDFGYIIRNYLEKGLLGYFSSNRNGGKGKDDLYGFVVKEKPGIKTFNIYGSVLNLATNNVIPGAEVRLLDLDGSVLKVIETDEKGAFRMEVPMQEGITVEATKARHSIFSDSYRGEALNQIQESAYNLGIVSIDDLVEETEDQTVLKLNKFYFDKGQSTITPAIATELDKVIDAVSRFPQMQLRIESHTDSRGGSATNFRISQSRADAIKNYLESNGVSSSNILYSIGYGEDKLLNDCTNGVFCLDTFHKKNERQLIVVLNYDLLF
ncbi:MAG: OmpA family protein [Eudoraea sp.]|nr:OmpA family protein [Bacteroidia bacterium]NNC61823.1 OmpA family protein [Eudoraea sp.]